MLSITIQGILFYYLEVSNGYDHKPFLKINLGLFIHYNKKVKEKDTSIKKIRNVLLAISGYSFLLAIILNIIIVLFKLK